jgi:pilus assembly protein CpaD
MKPNTKFESAAAFRGTKLARSVLCASFVAVALAGCKHGEEGAQVAGWTLVDPTERHPILVSQQPQNLAVRVSRGSGGLAPQQRNELLAFARRWRAADAGNSRLVIAAPSGGANEIAAMRAVGEIRQLLSENGFAETAISVEAYSQEGDREPPIRISYLRYVAEGPQCGQWTTNLAWEPQNLPYPNLGCNTQKNLAAMVANPADLLGPRSETDRSGERRDVQWEKYLKGDTTGAKKSDEEKVKVSSGDGG